MNRLAEEDSPWDETRVEAFFSTLEQETMVARGPARPVTPYHPAAAVLADFDPATLIGLNGKPPPTGEDLRRLLEDAVPPPGTPGPTRWSLQVGPRQESLRTYRTQRDLRAALTLNARSRTDMLQQLLDGYIRGEAPPVDQLEEEWLTVAIQVVGWLTGVPLDEPLLLPDLDAMRRRLDLLRLVNPLRRMVGGHFHGRTTELTAIREHVAGPPGPPLMIWGVGGTGKSTLLAKVALAFVEGEWAKGPAPIVYLDLDRKLLPVEQPAALLLEAVRQLTSQLRDHVVGAALLAELIREDLQMGARSAAFPLTGTGGGDRLARFADFLADVPEWSGRPLLFVLDTFEEVQYRSKQTVELVWRFLGQLQDKVPQTRIVVAGRVLVEGHAGRNLELTGLDEASAVACLASLGVSRELAATIYDHVGGNPLALRLAAELVRLEPAASVADYLAGDDFRNRLREELVQGYLFRRILGHIHSTAVRKLAHPGLVLRRITPELIQEVLAGPCQIQVPDRKTADRLWRELARETALVVQESGEVLRHRPDLRREMIGLLRESKLGQVLAIHQTAVAYYSRFDDTASRAEEIYHRLCLNQPRAELDRRWRPDVEPLLRNAVDELPPDSMAYLASRTQDQGGLEAISLGSSYWQQVDLEVWERKTARWVRNLIRQDQYEEALEVMSERTDRTTTSPLFLLEARVLKNLNQWQEARTVLQRAVRSWPLAEFSAERLDLLLLLTQVTARVGTREAALEVLEEAECMLLLKPPPTPLQRLEVALAKTQLTRRANGNQEAAHRLAADLAAVPDKELSTVPVLARRTAAELLVYHPEAAARVLRLVGLGSLDAAQLRRLQAAAAEGDGPALASTESAARWLVGALKSREGHPEAQLLQVLADLLRKDEDAVGRRRIQTRAAQERGSRHDDIAAVQRALMEAFDRSELDPIVHKALNVRLEDVSPGGSFQKVVYDALQWADRRGFVPQLLAAASNALPQNRTLTSLEQRFRLPQRTAAPADALRLRKSQLERLTAVLVTAFPELAAFYMMLRYRLENVRLPASLTSRTAADEVRQLVDQANEEGWLGPLLLAVREANPIDPGLYQFTEDFGLTAARPEDDRKLRDSLPEFDIDRWRSRLGELEGLVCGISIADRSEGTGILVGRDLIVTARHLLQEVFLQELPAAKVTIWFDHRRLDNGTILNPGVAFQLAPNGLIGPPHFPGQRDGDYVILRVAGTPGDLPVGWPRVEPNARPRGWIQAASEVLPSTGPTPLCALYCQGRAPLKLWLDLKASINVDDQVFRYPRAGGLLAGAPLFDHEMTWIGIHCASRSREYANFGTSGKGEQVVETNGTALRAVRILAELPQQVGDRDFQSPSTHRPPIAFENVPTPNPAGVHSMTRMVHEVPFVRPARAPGTGSGFESTTEAPQPRKPDANSPPTTEQKARASDLFLRGDLIPEDLARARASRGGFEQVIGRPNFLPAVFLEIGAATSRATCLIRTSGIDYRGRAGSWSGTGFLLGSNVLVTNNHVLNSPDVAAAANLVFNYQAGTDGRPLATRTFRLRPDLLFLTSPALGGLDYTFVQVEGEPVREFGSVRVSRQAFAIAEGEFANVISHPDGRMKEVSLQENEVQWQDDLVVQYTSDTEAGSSGAAVCNNNWQLVALHHASKTSTVAGFQILNEGIKLCAIAADLERLARSGTSSNIARTLLMLFGGTDERLGFFGTLGRQPARAACGLEALVQTFQGTEQDIDVGFWNVEWLTKHYDTKTPAVAKVMHELNLDIWCLEESSPNAAAAVAQELKDSYGWTFGHLAAEPESADGKQSCTLLWNTDTVQVEAEEWGEPIETWLRTKSTDFDDLGLEGFEAVHGRIFDRYPALFRVTASSSPHSSPFTFYVVPVHLKAMAEGSLRRKMASKILAAAVQKKIEEGASPDWIIGGDFNAELATMDFDNLIADGLVPVSAADEQGGAFSYVKGPKSLIDHIFLSPNLAQRFGATDYFIVAADKTFPDYIAEISDHRPVLIRLSLAAATAGGGLESTSGTDTAALDELRQRLAAGGLELEDGLEARRRRQRPRGSGGAGGGGRRPDLGTRTGYDADFLGNGVQRVALPGLPASLLGSAVVVNRTESGLDRFVLSYTHFSVVMNGERRMPFYSAVNIDGTQLRRIARGDNWFLDPRIPADVQTGDNVYKNNDLDRGHMTRRLDPVWGTPDVASQADADTFCFTNACPQHKDLNQREWLQLEDYVLNNAGAHNLRVSAITGPVLRATDRPYRGILLPQEFWKVVVIARDNGELSATGYLLSQKDLISGFEFVFGQFKTYQVRVSRIAELTGLDFGRLVNFDPLVRLGLESAASAIAVTGPESLVF